MGKGLGLCPESKGDFVAFAGGTGVFVFVDLVTRILLENLNVITDKDQQVKKDLVFHLYASFQSRKDSIALDLLEGAEKVLKKLGLSNYQLHLRLSDQKMPRWNEQFIKKEL